MWMEVVGPMQLRLRSRASGALTNISLAGTFPTQAANARQRQLLELLTLLSAGPVHVVLSAGVQGGSEWTDIWTRAIDAADAPLTVEFRVATSRHRRGSHGK
jgi:hypothetical protein